MDLQQKTAVKSQCGAVAASWCIKSSNAITLVGLLVLASGVGIYAAARTWMLWDRQVQMPFGQALDHIDHGLQWTGLIPLVAGVAGVTGLIVGVGAYSQQVKKPNELHRIGFAMAAMISMLAIAYGASLLAVPAHRGAWPDNGIWHYHVFPEPEKFPVAAALGISVLSLGGLITAGGLFFKAVGHAGKWKSSGVLTNQ
jgi:hypothetical protein